MLASALATIVSHIANSRYPVEIRNALFDTELFAIAKDCNGTDFRPIGMGSTFRKLAAKTIFHTVKSRSKQIFGDLQMCLQRCGTEAIVHSFRLAYDNCPELDIFAMDASNAYNSANRMRGLASIIKDFPEAVPFLYSSYGSDSKAWFHGLNQLVNPIVSAEGYQQGDILGNWCYGLTMMPFCKGLADIVGVEGIVRFFVDDGTICAPFEEMLHALEYIRVEGPKYGYYLSLKKGKQSYMLGRCESLDVAEDRRRELTNLGIDIESIKIHPDNFIEDPSDVIEAKDHYGMKILGSYIGTPEFISAQLPEVSQKLEILAKQLLKFDNVQGRFILFQKCFCFKLNYIMRTIPPQLITTLVNDFDNLKQKVAASLFRPGGHVDDNPNSFLRENQHLWLQLCLPIAQGGLGLGYCEDLSPCAFAASMIDCGAQLNNCSNIFNIKKLLDDHIIKCFRPLQQADQDIFNSPTTINFFYKSIEKIKRSAGIHDDAVDFQMSSDIFDLVSGEEKLQNILYNRKCLHHRICEMEKGLKGREKAWYISISSPEAGAWLSALPNQPKFVFTNEQFTTCLLYRFFLNIPFIQLNQKCDCKSKFVIDMKGHHLATGCGILNLRSHTHDFVKLALKACMDYAGWFSRLEPRGLFPDNDKRPDIEACPPGNLGADKELFDVMVTSPLPNELHEDGSPWELTEHEVNEKGRAAKKGHKLKMKKYEKDVQAIQSKLRPFIIESTGLMHEESKVILKRLASCAHYSKPYIPECVLVNYFFKIISCALMRGIADCVNRKINNFSMKSRRNDEFSVAELVPLGSIVEDLVASSFFPHHDDLE